MPKNISLLSIIFLLVPTILCASNSLPIPNSFITNNDDASSVFVNPAGLGVRSGWHTFTMQSYHTEGDFGDSFVAGKWGPVGGGFHYTRQDGSIFRTFVLGSGIKVGRQFFAGVSANWWSGDADPADLDTDLQISDHGSLFLEDQRGFSFDVGIMVRPYSQLSVAFMTRHLGDRDLPPHVHHTYEMGLAARPLGTFLTLSAYSYIPVRDFEAQDYDAFDYRVGAIMELLRGVNISGTVNPDEKYAFGARLNFHRFSLGYQLQLEAEKAVTHTVNVELTAHQFPTILPKRRQLIEIIIRGQLGDEKKSFSLLGNQSGTSAIDILEHLKKAAEDPEVEGILLHIAPIKTGIIGGFGGILQDVRAAIMHVRRQGKRVVAFIESGGSLSEYYLASAADRVVMPPAATVGGLGTLLTITRTLGLYEKLGIDWDYLTVGDYKSTLHDRAPGITDEQAELVTQIVDDLYDQMLVDIAETRQFTPSQLEKYAQGAFYSASSAFDIGLIDEIGYYDLAKVVLARLCNVNKSDPEAIEVINIRKKIPYKISWKVPPRVAVIGAYGTIETGKSGQDLIFGGRTLGTDTIVRQLENVKDDDDIKAAVLRIDSSGGSVLASDMIWHTIQKLKQVGKPVVVSMADVAGSGGYWIAANADSIFAMPATLTGSIGVASARPIYARLFEKLGIKEEIFAHGDFMTLFSRTDSLTVEEKRHVLDLMEEHYDMFITKVSQGRNLTESRARALAEGRIYTGKQAKAVGLVDEIGGLNRAILSAARLAKIDQNYETLFFRDDNTFFPSRMLSNLSSRIRSLSGFGSSGNHIRVE